VSKIQLENSKEDDTLGEGRGVGILVSAVPGLPSGWGLSVALILNTTNFFSNRVVEAWNIIPGVIKRSKNSELF
jgi:hypothetical protein